MSIIKCEAQATYKIDWTGTPGALVALADEMSFDEKGEGLDSMDAGDAMGFLIEKLCDQGDFCHTNTQGRLTATIEVGTFIWEGLPE